MAISENEQNQLSVIDEILMAEDPSFMASLNELSADELNLATADISITSDDVIIDEKESVLVKLRLKLLKFSVLQRRLILAFGFLMFAGLPLLFLAMSGAMTPEYKIADIGSLAEISDEVLSVSTPKRNEDLLRLFRRRKVLIRLDDHVVYMKPKDGIRIIRMNIVVQIDDEKFHDEVLAKKSIILDTLTTELQMVDYTAFSGLEGKRRMRNRLLNVLRSRVSPHVHRIFYSLVIFYD